MRLVLVGPPGAGKGTQANFLAAFLSVPKISTGDIFRANASAGTQLGLEAKRYMDAGHLVPDEVTIGMVRERLDQQDTRRGFLLDGFPRNVHQAQTLDEMLAQSEAYLDVVVELVVNEDEVVRRLSGRRTCRTCNHVWHVDFDPPEMAGVCDTCGGELFQRDDDREETVRERLKVYAEQTMPLINYYRNTGILRTIVATVPVEDVTKRAVAVLQTIRDSARA